MVGRVGIQLDEQLGQQTFPRDDPIRTQQQERQQCALLRAAHLKRLLISERSQRTEDPKPQAAARHVPRSFLFVALEYHPLGHGWDNLGTAGRDDPRMLYTAKCYWPGVTEDVLLNVADRARRHNDTGDRAFFRGLLYLPGDETALSLFEADSPASVWQA